MNSEFNNIFIEDIILLERKKSETQKSANRNISVFSCRLEGFANFKNEDKKYTVTKGNVLFLPAMCHYEQSTAGETIIAVHTNITGLKNNKLKLFKTENKDETCETFYELYRIWQEDLPQKHYRCLSILYGLIAELLENEPDNVQENQTVINRQILNDNLYNPNLSVTFLAKENFLSEQYYRKKFKEEYGASPNAYIIGKRIERAKTLLSGGYCSIEDVALSVGFKDVKYFSSVFKKTTGTTPGKYRNE